MAKTKYTINLENKRNSPDVQRLKRNVLRFLTITCADDEICYKLKCDLSKKIDMPFYGEAKNRVSSKLTPSKLGKEYIRLLMKYDNFKFSEELLTLLFKQQSQTFRKIHPKSKYQINRKREIVEGVFEHPVPSAYSRRILLECVENKDLDTACQYINFMITVPQVFLSTEDNEKVNSAYHDTMPDYWNWKNDNPFARYVSVNLPEEIYIPRQ